MPKPRSVEPTPAAPPTKPTPKPAPKLPPCPTRILLPGSADPEPLTNCTGEQAIIDCRKAGNPHPRCEGIPHAPTVIPTPEAQAITQWRITSNGAGGNCRYLVTIESAGKPITSAVGIRIEAHRAAVGAWVALPGPDLWTPTPGTVVTSICGLEPVDRIRVHYLGGTKIAA